MYDPEAMAGEFREMDQFDARGPCGISAIFFLSLRRQEGILTICCENRKSDSWRPEALQSWKPVCVHSRMQTRK